MDTVTILTQRDSEAVEAHTFTNLTKAIEYLLSCQIDLETKLRWTIVADGVIVSDNLTIGS